MEIGKTFYAKDRAEWRAWLEANSATEPEIWLVAYNKAAAVESVGYDEAVEEALCFGWIDSINKKLGEDSRAQRYTPRRPGSKLSALNRERIIHLIEEGRMTPIGLERAGAISVEGFETPGDIVARLKKDADTWRNFEGFREAYKRIRIGFIEDSRRRPEVFEQRLAYFLKMTRAGKMFGTMPWAGREGARPDA